MFQCLSGKVEEQTENCQTKYQLLFLVLASDNFPHGQVFLFCCYALCSVKCQFSEPLPQLEKVKVLGGKRETNFSLPGVRQVLEVVEDKHALQLDFPLSATSSPHPEGRQQATKPPAPALLSPARSEHQYDVPFSHLLPR